MPPPPPPLGGGDGSAPLMLPGGGIVTEICGALKGVEPSEAGPGMGMLVPRGLADPCLGDGAGSGLGIGIGR
jgi:hypothetical protein